MIRNDGIKIDGVTYQANTWYKLFETTNNKLNLNVTNMGVDNELSEGNVFCTIRTDETAETRAVTSQGIITLEPGAGIRVEQNASIWINADTADTCIEYDYFEV